MPYMLVRHKVENYARWKPVFDEHAPIRTAASLKVGHLFRDANDPDEVLILFEAADLQKAREFAESSSLRDAMEKAGVADKPDIYFLEEVDRPRI